MPNFRRAKKIAQLGFKVAAHVQERYREHWMNVIFHHAKRINNGLVSYEQPPYLFPQEELLANAVVDASTNPSYPDLTATEMYALFYPTWQPYFVWDSYLEGYTIL